MNNGMTPMQAIPSATIHGAELLDQRERVGSIETGKYADIIAVACDPSNDITPLERTQFGDEGPSSL